MTLAGECNSVFGRVPFSHWNGRGERGRERERQERGEAVWIRMKRAAWRVLQPSARSRLRRVVNDRWAARISGGEQRVACIFCTKHVRVEKRETGERNRGKILSLSPWRVAESFENYRRSTTSSTSSILSRAGFAGFNVCRWRRRDAEIPRNWRRLKSNREDGNYLPDKYVRLFCDNLPIKHTQL